MLSDFDSGHNKKSCLVCCICKDLHATCVYNARVNSMYIKHIVKLQMIMTEDNMMLYTCSVLTYCSCSVNKAPGKLDKLIYTCSANTNRADDIN